MVAVPVEDNKNNNNNNNNAEPLFLSLTPVSEVKDVTNRGEQDVLVMVTVKAPLFESEEKRAPVALSAVIDVSGSMSGDKIELVRKATIFVSKELNEHDSMSVIAYNESVSVPFPLSKMNKENQEKLERVVNGMRAGGGTNIAIGLQGGIQQLNSQKESRGQDTVVSTLLFTDGQANSGPRDAEGILKYGGGAGGSTVNTFGFGSDHDANMLNELARKGEGAYFYIKGTSDIGPSFANCLGGLTSVFAQKIKIRAEGLNGVTISESFTKYNESKDANGKWNELEMQDIQSEEQKDIIFKIKVPTTPNPTEDFQAVKFTLTYFNVLSKQTEDRTVTLSIKRSEIPDPQTRPVELDIEYNRVAVAKALDEASYKADRGNLTEAKAILNGAIELLKSSITASDPKNLGLKADLEKAVAAMQSKHSYESGGQQMMQTNSNSHWQQRQTSSVDQGQERYATKKKASVMSRYV
eukprot:TRINITY_DN243_c0_g1_i1.p1 TRINITY_DN243_c0_g1~~TRINITY_DN243_c0_g1_i1.p1  ORF type:complete len:517 (-),score=175.86 TRINITY_DN243_c0_g1_i1:60-1460(-)